MDHQNERKPRILCLHGFRESAKILEGELVSRWPSSVCEKMDLVFIDAPFPAEGKPKKEGTYGPPYYEWFQSNEDYSEYRNFDECIGFLEEHLKDGPFHGVLGVSQGGLIAAALPGMQTKGVALKGVDKIRCVIIISGGKFGGSKYSAPKLAEQAFSSPIECLSVHFIGEKDPATPSALELIDSFVEPVVIHHPGGHGVPILDEKSSEIMLDFIEKLREML